MKLSMRISVAAVATLVSSAAFSAPLTFEWRERKSKVICGGSIGGKDLDMKVSLPNEVMKAESGRILLFIDLHKEGTVRWLMSDAMTDEEYDARQLIMAKLSAEEQALLKTISVGRQIDLHSGMTEQGFVTITQTMGDKNLLLSCQEIKN